MKLNNIIYGLRDSRNDLYYYIGKSSVGESRPKQHLLKSHSDKVNKWVQEVEGTGNVVYIDILETIEYKEGLKKAEKYWINY
ncbi:MAG: GIY-YIG nuclease family protein, partial [Candidatus Peribacteraceae bacterium]|nr:GIY-YIG nuclease family protein [Candidatus Peribacteraceae bacterium]